MRQDAITAKEQAGLAVELLDYSIAVVARYRTPWRLRESRRARQAAERVLARGLGRVA